jgi:alkanesulfonate monooxygenase SsuD/methylene tetrahydromethanopterin reductase-like flavin-dependent oxidoreductase (luciferase family)
LRQPRTTFDGAFYHLTDAPCDPKPVQVPLPTLIGGGGERRTLRIAARLADEWHVWGTAAEFNRKSDIRHRHCEDIGRDPSTIKRASGAVVLVANEQPIGHRDEGMDATDAAGTPAIILDLLGGYRDARVDEFIVRDHRETALPVGMDSLSLFSTAVMGALR